MSEVVVCSVAGCDKSARKKTWCEAHYKRWYRYGDPLGLGNRRGKTLGYRVPRLPMQPLLNMLRRNIYTTPEDYCALLGMDDRYFRRLHSRGLTPKMADRLAVKVAHVHPGYVWGDAWWDLDKAYVDAAELETVA